MNTKLQQAVTRATAALDRIDKLPNDASDRDTHRANALIEAALRLLLDELARAGVVR